TQPLDEGGGKRSRLVFDRETARARIVGPANSLEVPRASADAAATPPECNGAPPSREIRHVYTRSLPPLLSQLGVSLLVSTYQAGNGSAASLGRPSSHSKPASSR